jgi:hypothetical protein
MRKLSLIFVAVLVAALAGCAGDTTSATGDLSVVQGLQLDAASTGRTIVLVWTAVSDNIDGYKVFFKSDGTGSFEKVGEVTTTTFTHNATVAGKYVVVAYKGDNTSSANSNEVSTMPSIVSTTYTIYDNYSAADKPSGFIFGATSGQTGMAGSTAFKQDIYAYDESKGDSDVWLYSGNFGVFGNGNKSYFQTPASGAYGNCDPAGSWISNSYKLLTSDSVVFVKLPYSTGAVAYAKIYGLTVTPDETANNGTKVSFSYEYQSKTLGLTVFTSNASN